VNDCGAILKVRFAAEVQREVPSEWLEHNVDTATVLAYYTREIEKNLRDVQSDKVNFVVATGYDLCKKEMTA
jgi:hypothetical protein